MVRDPTAPKIGHLFVTQHERDAVPLHIFRAGTHTAMGGQTIAFGDADLAATAKAYDPAVHEAPIVVGHPSLDAPAYGWVKSLTAEGGDLFAEPHEINPAFAEMVRSKAYKKISASFFAPDAPNNPTPGVYALRHVGFLGATPPAVKGLRPVDLADDVEGVVTVDFGDLDPVTITGLFRRLRDWVIGRYGQDEADKVLPPYELDYLQAQAAQPDPDDVPTPAYADPKKEQVLTRTTTDFAEQTAALAAREAALFQREAALHRRDSEAFIESQIAAGRFLPALKAQAIAFMEALAGGGGVVEFADGDGKTVRSSTVDAFKSLLARLPKAVDFSEVAGQATDVTKTASTVDFATPPGVSVDGERLAIHQRAMTLRAKNPSLTYIDAVRAAEGAK